MELYAKIIQVMEKSTQGTLFFPRKGISSKVLLYAITSKIIQVMEKSTKGATTYNIQEMRFTRFQTQHIQRASTNIPREDLFCV